MMRIVRYALAGVTFLLLGGCGIQQVQPAGPTAAPTNPPIPTPTAVPTLTVSGGSVAARVQGTAIPMRLFRDLVNAQYKNSTASGTPLTPADAAKQALGQFIEYVVALREAQKLGVTPSVMAIGQRINQAITQSRQTKAAYYKSLQQQGITPSDLHYLVKASLAENDIAKKLFPLKTSGKVAQARQILIAARRPLSRGEAFFTRPITPSTDKCTHKILMYSAAKVEAQKLLSRLKHGANFATLAKTCSDDTYSAATGGSLLGPLNTKVLYPYTEAFAPNIEAAIFNGAVNKYQLLGSIDGWHIIQVTSRSHTKYPTTVVQNLQGTVASAVQQYHLQSWLNSAAQVAYAHTTVYEHVT